jgi:AraC-like DNA-binding protein
MLDSIAMHNGRRVRVSGDDYLVNVFDHASEALQCAKDIQTEFQHGRKKSPVVFTIGLSAGQPVTENNEFIEETVRLARRLSLVADEGHIFVSSLFGDLCDDITKNGNKNVRSLTDAEEEFLTECFDVIDTHLTDENFSIDALVKSVGMSRTQLYRKVQSLTGKAPNTFIRDLRLERAKSLLKRKTGNISEIAYEVGFSNPSYFAKCFAKRFGYLPSESPQ